MSRIRTFRETGERSPALRVLATICNGVGILLLTLAALLLALGVASYLGGMIGSYNGLYLGAAVVWSFGLFFAGIQSLAMGSFFRLAIHVEENTRATAQALDRLRSASEGKPDLDPRSVFLS